MLVSEVLADVRTKSHASPGLTILLIRWKSNVRLSTSENTCTFDVELRWKVAGWACPQAPSYLCQFNEVQRSTLRFGKVVGGSPYLHD